MTRSISTTEPAVSRARPSPWLVLALLTAIGWLALSLTQRSDPAPTRTQLAQIEEELFGQGARCRGADAQAGQRLAELAETRAAARAERYPFHPGSGPAAVHLWGEAEACWILAESPEQARAAARHREAWRVRILQDLRAHQLRLRRAKKNKQPAEALAETRALRALFEGAPGHSTRHGGSTAAPGYVDWLAREERRLEGTPGK